MILSPNLCYHIDQAVAALNHLVVVSKQTTLQGKARLWVQDYYCWLHNAIVADYNTVTFLLKQMPDINQFDLRPIYCILRSTLEKYADVINLFHYGQPYEQYLWYLTHQSQGDEDLAEGFSKHAKEHLNLPKCNRNTRYYLIDKRNSLYRVSQVVPQVPVISKKLKNIDSKYSRILHNNIDPHTVSRVEEVIELLLHLHYMMYTSTILFSHYYHLDSTVVSSALTNLYSAIHQISNSCPLC